MSSPQNQLSTTGEDRTKVIVSACESSSSCRECRTAVVDTADVAPSSRRKCLCPLRPLTTNRCVQPFRRRVSFSDATVIGTNDDDDRCCRTMQDDDLASTRRDNDREIENKTERETFYDIWQADDSSTGRSDDGYSESTPRIDNYAENHCRVSGCTFNDNDKGQRSQSENIGEEQTVESDGRTKEEWTTGNGDVCPADRIAGNKARSEENDTVWNEDVLNATHKNVDSIGSDEYRMRGGCGGCCCGAREKYSVWRSSQDYDCRCEGLVPKLNESYAPSPDRGKTVCVVPLSRSCCRCPRVCKKTARCEPPPCTTCVRSCDGGGCCGGGCGKPGQICMPSPRICNSPVYSSRGKSPCALRCPPQSSCSISGCCSRPNNCRRSCSPRCLSVLDSGCCLCSVNDGAKCVTDGACCRLRLPCECLGGGLDCRRCGRKVYQAEMQIASGVPYHSICFSCFCCRKPLEPLTYQENGGEIYCKRWY